MELNPQINPRKSFARYFPAMRLLGCSGEDWTKGHFFEREQLVSASWSSLNYIQENN